MSQISLTFALMDAPFECERTTTVMRLIKKACTRGYKVNVFAYEGAVGIPFEKQSAHANAVHGNSLEEENHPLAKDWVKELFKIAKDHGGELNWINCGLCVDERGVNEVISGVKRGTPGDLLQFSEESNNTLFVSTK